MRGRTRIDSPRPGRAPQSLRCAKSKGLVFETWDTTDPKPQKLLCINPLTVDKARDQLSIRVDCN
jgi:hypothetical protein